QALARLNHPHIVTIYDSGHTGRLYYFVMEYVDGANLRVAMQGGKLTPDAALAIVPRVCDALEYAHEEGVVHRDVKPENILLHDGRAMVADFGIALALARTTGDVRLTETGMSVGTPHYMSPEQAMGEKHITARTDIFALGAILYEMLAGEPPFTGESAQLIVAKMMTAAPTSVITLRPAVPAHVSLAIDGALQRVAADRFASATAFAEALQRPGATTSTSSLTRGAARSTARSWLIGATAAAMAGAAGYWIGAPDPAPRSPGIVARTVIPLARDQLLSIGNYPLAISPDGAFIVYVGDDSGKAQLFLRALADTISHVVPGTEGASTPFFSPDGAWIGFFARTKLKKVPRSGGAPIDLADAPPGELGADWSADGTILYAFSDGSLNRTRADGGAPTRVMVFPSDSMRRYAHGLLKFPSFLPGADRALISTDSGVGVLDLTSGDIRVVSKGRQGRYLQPGYLLFDDNEGRIRVVPFDADRSEVAGSSVPVFEAFRGPGGGAGYFAVSQTGTLVYMPGGFQRTLVRVDRYGRETPIDIEPRGYRFPSVSPDGKRIAVTVDPRPSAIWLIDPARAQAVPLTTDHTHSIYPIWSRDGTRIAFMRYPDGRATITWMLAQAGAERHLAFRSTEAKRWLDFSASNWTGNDDLIGTLNNDRPNQVGGDIARTRVGDSTTTTLIATPADDRDVSLSPDGNWLAYSSDISGANEVYVRRYADDGAVVLVSARGGVEPHWSADGRELLYRSGTRLMAVAVRTRPDFAVTGSPRFLFSGPFDFSQGSNWSPSPDGTFIMVKADPTTGRQLRVVFNWFDELKAIGQK
ncbi:MAG: protein kinase, partial [Gemmatimonadaceae bacterium]|nr:protein kinase [Gemmatimonadaceae bacterium]